MLCSFAVATAGRVGPLNELTGELYGQEEKHIVQGKQSTTTIDPTFIS